MSRTSCGLGGLVLLGVLSHAAYAQAGKPDSLGASVSSDRLRVSTDSVVHQNDPGTSLTVRLVISNGGSSPRTVEIKTGLPEGWRQLSGVGEEVIAPGGRILRFLQIAIAHDAAAGEYKIVQTVRAHGLEQDLRVQATVAVRARRIVSVVLLHEPLFVSSGSSYRATFLVANRGNVRTRIRLDANSERNLPATVDTLTELDPGESREVGVTVNTENILRTDATSHHVTLLAEADGGISGDGNVISHAMAGTQVIPKSEPGSNWYSMPLHLILSSQTSQYKQLSGFTSSSFEIHGSAPLTEGGASVVDLVARAPRMDRSLFAQRDEYRLGITNRKYTVRLGDQIFAQSPLSLNGMIGSGASAKVSLGRWTTGFASGSDRFTPGAGVERAAFLGMEPNERWNLSTNVVHSSQFGGATLGTLYARFTPTQHEIFEIERGARLGGVNSAATLLRASGQRGQLTFDVHHEAADSGYQNLLGASRQDWATLMYRPHRLLRFSGRIDDRMSTGAPIPYSSGFLPSSRRSGLLATMGVDIGSNLSAGVRSFEGHEENSASNVVAMVDAERSVWGRFRMRLPGVMITSAAERGISDDPFGGPRRSFSATTVQAEVPLFGRASFAGFVDHSTGLRRSASVADELLTVGGSAQIQMGSLTASMSAAGKPAFLRRQPSDTLQPELAWLDATLAYQSSPGRTLTFRVRSMAAGIRMPNNTSARISYSMPLRMPVGRSKSTGRVVGRVYDAETGMGIANALVRVGEHSALTDDDGRIVIGGVAPSQYPVYVDLGSRQASGLGFQEPSMQISTRAGYTSEMLMGVVRMGRLRGHLQLFELIDVPRLLGDSVRQQKKGGLSGIVVTLINGTEERRVVSDSGGWFELRDARPGTWRVVVPTSELPAQHFVEGDSVRIVDLAAGATSNIEINVRPRQRRILPLDAVPTIPPMIPSGGTSPAREKVAPPVVRDVRDSAQVARPRTTQGADAVPSARDNGSGAGDTDAHAPRRRALPSMQHRTSTALRVSLTSKQPTMRKPGTQKTPKKPTPFTLASYGSEWEIGFANVTGGTN